MSTITVKTGSGGLTVPSGTTLLDIYKLSKLPGAALAGVIDNTLAEMRGGVFRDCEVIFIDSSHPLGFRVYQRSAAFLLLYGVRKALGPGADVTVRHSVNKNLYFEFTRPEDAGKTEPVEAAMRDAVFSRLAIERLDVPPAQAAAILAESGDDSALRSLRFSRTGEASVYRIGGFCARAFGPLAASAGDIRSFRLVPDGAGFYLQLPKARSAERARSAEAGFEGLHEVKPLMKIRRVFDETAQWSQILGVESAVALNEAVCSGRGGDIIRVSEALHEKRLASMADAIEVGGKRIALVAGPSSSGKTTFANRLGVQLRVLGITPHIISLDNYFRDRRVVPRDESGQPDFESLGFVDAEQFNADMARLLDGETVEIPRYNFYRGEREYKGDFITMGNRSALIIEGIHGLNAKLTESLPDNLKYKIFISALAQLNIDRHNRMPMSDARLLRRIVRDMRTRGHSASRSLNMWESVQRGEVKNIFPFQEDADAVFNSALAYELCILKPYVERLLFGITQGDPSHADARRLLSYLDCFVPMPPDDVPNNSIVREFIGGSCFSV